MQLLVNGAAPRGVFPGIPTERPDHPPLPRDPERAVPEPPREKLPPPDPAVKDAPAAADRARLPAPGDDDGRFGPATQNAILAFQKWERLDRTGLLDAQTKSRLATATRPSPLTHGGAGKRAEILLDRQVALLIDDNEVVRDDRRLERQAVDADAARATTASTPRSRAGGRCRSASGSRTRCRSSAASPSTSSQDVPAYPASHGCVRQSTTVARWTYDFAYVGMPVKVIARS